MRITEDVLYARFGEALTQAHALLDRSDLSARQRNAALELVAIAQLANRDVRSARQTLGLLYARDPDHRLNVRDTGPNVIAAFDRARESSPAPIDVTLVSSTPDELPSRVAPVIAPPPRPDPPHRVGDGG